MNRERFREIKIVVCGLPNVGKTCLIKKYTTGEYADIRNVTVMCDISNKYEQMFVEDDVTPYMAQVKLQIWDTQGDFAVDRLSFLVHGTHAVVLAFELTYQKLLQYASDQMKFLSFLDMYMKAHRFPYVIVVGTKSDKLNVDLSDFEFDDEEATTNTNASFPRNAESYGCEDDVNDDVYMNLLNLTLLRLKKNLKSYGAGLNFIATSSKTGENVKDCFRILIKEVIQQGIDKAVYNKSIHAVTHEIQEKKKFNYLSDSSIESPTIKLTHILSSEKEEKDAESFTCCN